MATDASQPLTEGAHSKSSTISSELSITGNVTSTGGIHLDGRVQGEILCASLVLGENSELKGSAVAGEVLISGRLTGSVRARQVRLEAGSHVEGDLLYQSLVMSRAPFSTGPHAIQTILYHLSRVHWGLLVMSSTLWPRQSLVIGHQQL